MSSAVTAASLLEEAIRTRRDLHAHPETAWTEFRTTSLILRRLRELGWSVRWGREAVAEEARMGVPPAGELDAAFRRAAEEGADPALLEPMAGGFTGCVAELSGGAGPGPTVGLRFDIDGLDVRESASAADHRPAREGFASRHPGAMHACGHDSHTAMGLGAAALLAARRAEWPGKVRLLFQPGEEGTRGAAAMVAAGWLDDIDGFIAVHVGAQSHRSGEIIPGITGFLATRKLDLRFRGREAHAGLEPEYGRNALLAAAFATIGLHALPRHSAGNSRVNVGVLHAGSGRNVIAGEAFAKLELRAETTEIVDEMEAQTRAVVGGAAASQRVEATIEVVGGAPSASSDPEMMAVISRAASQAPSVREIGAPCRAGASDDATAMMQRVQSHGGKATYMIVGSALPSGHHTPLFDIDEAVMAGGIETLAGATLAWLRGEGTGSA